MKDAEVLLAAGDDVSDEAIARTVKMLTDEGYRIEVVKMNSYHAREFAEALRYELPPILGIRIKQRLKPFFCSTKKWPPTKQWTVVGVVLGEDLVRDEKNYPVWQRVFRNRKLFPDLVSISPAVQ